MRHTSSIELWKRNSILGNGDEFLFATKLEDLSRTRLDVQMSIIGRLEKFLYGDIIIIVTFIRIRFGLCDDVGNASKQISCG